MVTMYPFPGFDADSVKMEHVEALDLEVDSDVTEVELVVELLDSDVRVPVLTVAGRVVTLCADVRVSIELVLALVVILGDMRGMATIKDNPSIRAPITVMITKRP